MTELKPCPFCGGTDVEKIDEIRIGCNECHIVVKLWSFWDGRPRDVEDIWNKRATVSEMETISDDELLALFNTWLDSARFDNELTGEEQDACDVVLMVVAR